MNALQQAAAGIPPVLTFPDPEVFSPRDVAMQVFFARLVLHGNRIREHEAYREYEKTLQRENTYVELTGGSASPVLSRRAFTELVDAVRCERESSVMCRPRRPRRSS